MQGDLSAEIEIDVNNDLEEETEIRDDDVELNPCDEKFIDNISWETNSQSDSEESDPDPMNDPVAKQARMFDRKYRRERQERRSKRVWSEEVAESVEVNLENLFALQSSVNPFQNE